MSKRMFRDAEWKALDVNWIHGNLQYIFRRAANQDWQPWVIVTQSAIMARNNTKGLGLYAARNFKRDEFIGSYNGKVIETFKNRNLAISSKTAQLLVARGNDKLTTRACKGAVELIDGTTCGPPFVQYINDPRGTTRTANTMLTSNGWIKASHDRIPKFNIDLNLDDNIKSELRYAYGDEYWIAHAFEARD